MLIGNFYERRIALNIKSNYIYWRNIFNEADSIFCSHIKITISANLY